MGDGGHELEAAGLDVKLSVVGIKFKWFAFGGLGFREFEVGLHAMNLLYDVRERGLFSRFCVFLQNGS